jgi:hypothetical protein
VVGPQVRDRQLAQHRKYVEATSAQRRAADFPVTGAFTRSRIVVPSGCLSARSTSHPSVTRSHPGAQRRRPCLRPPCPLASRGHPRPDEPSATAASAASCCTKAC